MRITPEMLQAWFTCPLRYKFFYVDKVHRPPTHTMIWREAVSKALVYCMERVKETGKVPPLKSMVKRMTEHYYGSMIRQERPAPAGFARRMFAFGETICHEFRKHDVEVMNIEKVGFTAKTELKRPGKAQSDELVVPVQVIDSGQVGLIHITAYLGPANGVHNDTRLLATLLATGNEAYWANQISIRKGITFRKFSGVCPSGRMRWFRQVLNLIIPQMENGPWPPCEPSDPACHIKTCPFFSLCRAQYDAKGRVTRV